MAYDTVNIILHHGANLDEAIQLLPGKASKLQHRQIIDRIRANELLTDEMKNTEHGKQAVQLASLAPGKYTADQLLEYVATIYGGKWSKVSGLQVTEASDKKTKGIKASAKIEAMRLVRHFHSVEATSKRKDKAPGTEQVYNVKSNVLPEMKFIYRNSVKLGNTNASLPASQKQ
jgi:hypothetical protein